uniref:Putative glycoprotein n=1 Tax=Panonychus citri mivirus TaxID=2760845 RepID=A0A7G4YW61_9VIRU|nr:putative glycoprotein [Panonychus citri mivirus]
MPFNQDTCTDMIKYKKISLAGREIKLTSEGKAFSGQVTLFGIRNQGSGYCKGEDFMFDDIYRESAIMIINYNIMYNEGKTTWDSNTDSYEMPSFGSCSVNAIPCIDPVYGYFFPNFVTLDKCKEENLIIHYEGPALLVKISNQYTYLINRTFEAFALSKAQSKTMCKRIVFSTGLENLYVLEPTSDNKPITGIDAINKKTSKKMSLLLFADTLTKLVMIEQHQGMNLDDLVTIMDMKLCEIRRENFKLLISLAFINPDEFAYAITGGPGSTSIIRGEVAYVIKCQPVQVLFRANQEKICYNEIPVYYNNTEMFIQPKNHNLIKYGKQIECDVLFPVSYYVNGEWVTVFPHRQSVKPPLILDPNNVLTWKFEPMISMIKSGLYTEEDIKNSKESVLYGNRENFATNMVTRQLLNLDLDNQGNNRFLSYPKEKSQDWTKWTKFYHSFWFSEIGYLTSGILGVYIIYRIIKSIVEWIFSCLVLGNHDGSLKCIHILLFPFRNMTTYYITRRQKENEERLREEVHQLTNITIDQQEALNLEREFASI